MSLLVPMLHRARAGRNGNPPEMIDALFGHVARHHACVLPGDELHPEKLNVCLSFDDATFDFHHVVFPLLKKHGLRALLAVSPMLIRERIEAGREARLGMSIEEARAYPERGGYCTWPELRELADSGWVAVAAHGATHVRLDRDPVNLKREIVEAQALLEMELGVIVDSFVFPFGRLSPPARALVKGHYRHGFRIGQATNRSWDADLLYRVDADSLESPSALFSSWNRLRYARNACWNRLRRR